jgi:hypothetical protein
MNRKTNNIKIVLLGPAQTCIFSSVPFRTGLMLEANKSMLPQGCTNPRCYLITYVTKFCTMAHIFSINIAFSPFTQKNVHHFTCRGQKVLG